MDQLDRFYLNGNFGFIANRPPVVASGSVTTYREIGVRVDLAAYTTEPDGNGVRYLLTNITRGTASLGGDGRTVYFVPEAGYSGTEAGFDFVADDGGLRSSAGRVSVQLSSATLTSIVVRLSEAVVSLAVNQPHRLAAFARFSDGGFVKVPAGYVQWESLNTAAVLVDQTGAIWGRAAGVATVRVNKTGTQLHAAVAVTVGAWTAPAKVDVYPAAYILPVAGTRQILFVTTDAGGTITDLAAGATGTTYTSGNEAIVTVSANGLVTSVALGTTTVTVINGGVRQEIAFTVASLSASGVSVDGAGAIVQNADQIMAFVPPNSFVSNTITLNTLTQGQLPLAVPGGFAFVKGLDLNLQDRTPGQLLGLAIPAPANSQPGDVIYLFRAGEMLTGPGQTEAGWELVDIAIVGADGYARTSSPPYSGVAADSQFLFGKADQQRWFRLQYYYPNSNIEIVTEGAGGQTRAYFVRPHEIYQGLYPLPQNAKLIRVWRFADDGSAVARDGKATLGWAAVDLPAEGGVFVTHIEVADPNFDDVRPSVGEAEIVWQPDASGHVTGQVTIKGHNFGTNKDDVEVVFLRDRGMAIMDFANLLPGDFYRYGPASIDSVTDDTVRLAFPDVPGLARYSIIVTRRFELWKWEKGRNPVQDFVVKKPFSAVTPSVLPPSYVWVTNSHGNTVSVINSLTPSGPKIVANVIVGNNPGGVALTNDGLLAFVTNTGDGTVSVIDTITLQEIDLDPTHEGMDRIRLPVGAQPWYIATHPAKNEQRMFIADRARPVVYEISTQLFNVSNFAFAYTMHQMDPNYALSGMTGITVTGGDDPADKHYLVVASPGRANWYGGDFDYQAGWIFAAELKFGRELGKALEFKSRGVGFKPFGLEPGRTTANEVGVAMRGSDAEGLTLVNLETMSIIRRVEMDFAPAQRARQFFQQGRDAIRENVIVGTYTLFVDPSFGSTLVERQYASWDASKYFDVNNIEDVVFTADRQYAFVLGNNTFNGLQDFTRDPYLGHGSNIGVVKYPFTSQAKLIAATREFPRAWADQLTIDPYGIYVMATYKGTNEVVYYSMSDLIAVADAMAADKGDDIRMSVDKYAVENKLPLDSGVVGRYTSPNGLMKYDFERPAGTAVFNRPAGIASSPATSTEIIATNVVYLETGDAADKKPVILFDYVIYGQPIDPTKSTVKIALYRMETRDFEDGKLIGEVTVPWTLTKASEYRTGQHTARLTVPKLEVDDRTWYVVVIDPVSTSGASAVKELDDTRNNDAGFQVKKGALIAAYDGDARPEVFGTFIQGIELRNDFTLRLHPDVAGKLDKVFVKLNSQALTLEKRSNTAYSFSIDIDDLAAGDSRLEYVVYDAQSRVIGGEQFTIRVLAVPNWLKPPTAPGSYREIDWSPLFDSGKGAYVISAADYPIRWSTTLNQAIPGVGGTEVGFGIGGHLWLIYGLDQKIKLQDAGPSVYVTLFGTNLIDLDLPASSLLPFFGFDPFQIVKKQELPNVGLSRLLGRFPNMKGDEIDPKKVLEFFKMDPDLNDPLPGTFSNKLETALTIEHKPFALNDRLELTDGKLAVEYSIKKPVKWEREILIKGIPKLGNLKGVLGAEAYIAVKLGAGIEAKNGNIDVTPVKLTGETGGSLSAGLLAEILGVKVSGQLSTELALRLEWTPFGNPTTTFTIPWALKFAIVGEVPDVVKTTFYEKELVKSSNLLDFPDGFEFLPGLTAGDLLVNNSILTAAELGVLTGSTASQSGLNSLLSGLRLANPTDRDYFRFRTVETAGATSKIALTFTGSNPKVEAHLLDRQGVAVKTMTMTDASHGEIALAGLGAGEYILLVETDETLGVDYGLVITAPQTTGAALVSAISTSLAGDLVRPGQSFDVTVRVTNHGAAAAPASQGSLQWSRDTGFDSGDAQLLTPFDIPALAAGQSWERTFTVRLPTEVTGALNLGFTADRRSVVAESHRGDNLAVAAIEAGLAPDAFEANDTLVRATELGGVVAGREWTGLTLDRLADQDWFRLQLAETGTAADRLVVSAAKSEGFFHADLMDARGRSVLTEPAAVTDGKATFSLAGLPAGVYYLRVSAGDAPLEYTLALESAQRTAANLTLETLLAFPELRPGSGLETADVVISNFGGGVARSFTVALKLVDLDSSQEYSLGQTTVDVLAAGQTLRVSVPLNINAGWSLGSRLVLQAIVDGGQTVAELNELDNRKEIAVAVAQNLDAQEANEVPDGYVDLGVLRGAQTVSGRNLHSRYDADYSSFRLIAAGASGDKITVTFNASAGSLAMQLFDENFDKLADAAQVSAGVLEFSLNGRAPGVYYLGITGTGTALAYTLQAQAPNPAGADLAVQSIQMAERFVSGNSINVTAKIGNFGDAAGAAFNVRYFASADAVIDPASDAALTSLIPLTGLAAGASVTDTRSLDLSVLAAGDYYIGVFIDPEAVLSETTRLDNAAAYFIARLPAADASEPNDVSSQATAIALANGEANLAGLNLHLDADTDWFRVTLAVAGGATDLVRVNYVAGQPDLRLTLLDEAGAVVTFAQGSAGTVAVSLMGVQPGKYRIAVAGPANRFSYSTGYSLQVRNTGGGSSLIGAAAVAGSTDDPAVTISTTELAGAARALATVAQARWESVLGFHLPLSLNIEVADLPDSLRMLGFARGGAGGTFGQPLTGTIVLDANAAGAGWFIDTTPGAGEEFAHSVSGLLVAPGASPASGRYDLLSFLAHEIGHLLGMNPANASVASHLVQTAAGNWLVAGRSYAIQLDASREHLDDDLYPWQLMGSRIGLGERRLPGFVDAVLIRIIWGLPEPGAESAGEGNGL